MWKTILFFILIVLGSNLLVEWSTEGGLSHLSTRFWLLGLGFGALAGILAHRALGFRMK